MLRPIFFIFFFFQVVDLRILLLKRCKKYLLELQFSSHSFIQFCLATTVAARDKIWMIHNQIKWMRTGRLNDIWIESCTLIIWITNYLFTVFTDNVLLTYPTDYDYLLLILLIMFWNHSCTQGPIPQNTFNFTSLKNLGSYLPQIFHIKFIHNQSFQYLFNELAMS